MDLESIKFIAVLAALPISFFAYLNSLKARKISEISLQIAERAERRANRDYVDSIPDTEILDVVKINGISRVKLKLTNLRGAPFKINCLKVALKNPKPLTLKNYILSKLDEDFDWNFEPVPNFVWNPKGNLDDSEKYVSEAGQFLVVKDWEIILVSIPKFSEQTIYKYEIHTTHGIRSITGSVSSNGKVLFCNDFKQYYSFNR